MEGSEFLLRLLELFGGYIPWILLAVARPFGFTLLFAMFAWAKLDTGVFRMAFAIALAMPLLSTGVPTFGLEGLSLPFIGALIKEIFIGALLGFAASVPLAVALAGGGIIDMYRGALEGPPDPAGGTTSVFGNLFAVMTLWLFASVGGFQIVTSAIYSSYAIWPVTSSFPVFDPGADVLLFLIEKLLLSALILAGPLLILMFFSDVIHLVSAKFGKQINVTHLAFSTKNLLVAMVLPFLLVASIRFFKDELAFLQDIVPVLERFIS